jgi:uncharacterized membrane protein
MSNGTDVDEDIDCDSDSRQDLKHVCAEARETIDIQVEKIHEEESKAIKICRLNLLLLGVVASVISLYNQTGNGAGGEILNIPFFLGTTALIFSTIISAVGYTSSETAMGISEDALSDVREGNRDGWSYYCNLSKEYENYMEKNDSVHDANSYAITWSLTLAISSIMFYIIGMPLYIANIQFPFAGFIGAGIGLIIFCFLAIAMQFSSKFFGFFFGY